MKNLSLIVSVTGPNPRHPRASTSLRFVCLAALALPTVVACGAASDSNPSTGDADLSGDKCSKPALNAAEQEYGNDPSGTSVKALVAGKKYKVTVGKNNAEDGPEDFYVTFPSGCSSKPSAVPVPFFAPALQAATHTVYGKILSSNGNEMAASYATTESSLPSAARTQFNTWHNPKTGDCTDVRAYKVTVSGKPTFAVTCTVPMDSIKFDIAIWDASGADIDQAAVYHTNNVGTNGVSWQNETFEQQD